MLPAGFLQLWRAGAPLWLWYEGFSLQRLVLLQSMGSRHAGCGSCSARAYQNPELELLTDKSSFIQDGQHKAGSAVPTPAPLLHSLRAQAIFHSCSILRRTTSSQDTFSFSDSACFFSFLVFTDMSLSPTFSSRSLASVGKAVQRMAPFTGLQAVQGDSMRYYAHCPGPEFPASITCLFLASTNAKQNRQEPVFL